jgi:hypothetical protein
MTEKIFSGTVVRTTEENPDVTDWTPEARNSRQWGVTGIVKGHHNAHGISYEVTHPDGTVGHYDPTEIEVA